MREKNLNAVEKEEKVRKKKREQKNAVTAEPQYQT